jgi:hypothetical protein
VISALILEVRRGRMVVLSVGLVAVLYAGGITLFYPVVLDHAAEYEQLMSIYPKELMVAFGIQGSLGDAGTFFNSYVFQFLWPLVAAIAAIALGTRIAADAESGFLDLPLSTRLPRLRYLASAIVSQVLSLGAIALMMIGAIVIADLLIKPDFPTGRIVLAGVHALAMALAIAGVATLLAIAFLDRGRAGGLVAGILIVMYLLNVLAALSPDMAGLGQLSAFRYFNLRDLIDGGAYPIGDTLLYLAVAIAGWLLSFVAFHRRDLAA